MPDWKLPSNVLDISHIDPTKPLVRHIPPIMRDGLIYHSIAALSTPDASIGHWVVVAWSNQHSVWVDLTGHTAAHERVSAACSTPGVCLDWCQLVVSPFQAKQLADDFHHCPLAYPEQDPLILALVQAINLVAQC